MQKKDWPQKNFGQIFFWPNFFDPNFFWPKFFSAKFFFDPNYFGAKFFFNQIFFWLKFFLGTKKLDKIFREFWTWNLGTWIWDSEFGIQNLGFRIRGLGSVTWNPVFGIEDLGLRIWDLDSSWPTDPFDQLGVAQLSKIFFYDISLVIFSLYCVCTQHIPMSLTDCNLNYWSLYTIL